MISLGTLIQGCKLEPLKIDPCIVYPDLSSCFAVPLNQPGKAEYDRAIDENNVCVTSDEYALLQKHYRDLMELCGDRCE